MPREGFWNSSQEPDMLMPVANPQRWEGQTEFIRKLTIIERLARFVTYRGQSTCRVCGCFNGSKTYKLHEWEWPEGFAHYVYMHNVKPSDAFIEFINSQMV
jgi:hypothetical protein